MSTRIPLPPPGFDDLTVDQKLKYIQSLWDRIAADPEQVPVPHWHREIVRERLRAGEGSADDSREWNEVRHDLRRKLKEKDMDQ